jgi:hypothetical protein
MLLLPVLLFYLFSGFVYLPEILFDCFFDCVTDCIISFERFLHLTFLDFLLFLQEMTGLAFFMLDQSRKEAEYCMENAFSTYLVCLVCYCFIPLGIGEQQ